MLRSIDSKSLLIGGLLVLVVVCALGGAPRLDEGYYGRFAIVTNDSHDTGVYVLDTATGQVWQRSSQSRAHEAYEAFFAPKLQGYAPEKAAEPDRP